MSRIENVTVGDTDAVASGPYDFIRVGVAGDVVVMTRDGSKESPQRTTTFKGVLVGEVIEVDAQWIMDTGTTATDIVGWK